MRSDIGGKDIWALLGIATILQIWWIAIWGFAYMFLEAVAGKNKLIEAIIYITMMLLVVVVVAKEPELFSLI